MPRKPFHFTSKNQPLRSNGVSARLASIGLILCGILSLPRGTAAFGFFFDDHNVPGHDVAIGQGGDDDYDGEGGDDEDRRTEVGPLPHDDGKQRRSQGEHGRAASARDEVTGKQAGENRRAPENGRCRDS